MITNEQIRMIKTMVRHLGIKDELYREILSSYFEVNSCKELSIDQATSFIRWLNNQLNSVKSWTSHNNKTRYDELNNRQNMATPKQLRKIEAMWKDVSYQKTTADRKVGLRQFLEKKCGVSDIKFLDKVEVKKVIVILENMQTRKGKTYGKS